ncbi:MAG: DNA polymerase I, partial [Phycisphaerae bacterium]|nr:DNA polymerase I [Phycisphaerae bacterium]
NGYVKTIMGRKRNLADINSSNGNRRKLAERMAVNTVIQGSAADMIKLAMINLYRRIEAEGLAMKMMLQVHDELVLEIPDIHKEQYIAIIEEEMVNAMKLDVPIVVDSGSGANWLEAK